MLGSLAAKRAPTTEVGRTTWLWVGEKPVFSYCWVDELIEDRWGGEAGARRGRAMSTSHTDRQVKRRHKGERENRQTQVESRPVLRQREVFCSLNVIKCFENDDSWMDLSLSTELFRPVASDIANL